VAIDPSLRERTTQSTPSTVTQSAVVGPRGSRPQRAMTAGSPQAAADPDSGSVGTRVWPATVTGQEGDVHAAAVAAGASATSGAREQEESSTTATQSVAVVKVRLRVGLRRAPPCR
jgi:hypothetical protein